MADFRFPGPDKRTAVMGHTGSGKTWFAAWLLSHMAVDKMPWVCIDYKGDRLLRKFRNVHELSVRSAAPKRPGLYMLHPHPTDGDAVEDFMWRIWERGKCGLYVDEAYMLPGNSASPAFRALLTQGRAKYIPMIVLVQRPVWVSRFVFSEADFLSYFWLSDKRDRQLVQSFMSVNLDEKLPSFWSYWHDVAKNATFRLQPVPNDATILSSFEPLLRPRSIFASRSVMKFPGEKRRLFG